MGTTTTLVCVQCGKDYSSDGLFADRVKCGSCNHGNRVQATADHDADDYAAEMSARPSGLDAMPAKLEATGEIMSNQDELNTKAERHDAAYVEGSEMMASRMLSFLVADLPENERHLASLQSIIKHARSKLLRIGVEYFDVEWPGDLDIRDLLRRLEDELAAGEEE